MYIPYGICSPVADGDLIAFFCGHIFHKECVLDPQAIEAIEASRVRGIKGGVADKITEAALLKPYLTKGCEICGILDSGNAKDKGKGVLRIGPGTLGVVPPSSF